MSVLLTHFVQVARLSLGELFTRRRRFRILNPPDGAVLSGGVEVRLAVHDQTIGDQHLQLLIDGTVWFTGFFDIFQEKALARRLLFTIQTQELTNGPHLVSVQDSERSTSMRPSHAVRRIVCHNAISGADYDPLFSYSSDSSLPRMCGLRAGLTPAQPWRVVIRKVGGKEQGSYVKEYEGNGSRVAVEWDGRDREGRAVEDGLFTLTVFTCYSCEQYEAMVQKMSR